jgi:hypothetical protein
MKKDRYRLSLAGLCTVVIGLISLVFPSTAGASGCLTGGCTYYSFLGSGSKGHCGTFDKSCGCFSNGTGHGGQQQSACNAPPV